MKRYKIYQHNDENNSEVIIGIATIKDGFSWPGFFFGWIWMFVKELWLRGFIFLGIQIILVFIPSIIVYLILSLIVQLYIGYVGNELLETKLIRQKYKYIRNMEANDIREIRKKISNE